MLHFWQLGLLARLGGVTNSNETCHNHKRSRISENHVMGRFGSTARVMYIIPNHFGFFQWCASWVRCKSGGSEKSIFLAILWCILIFPTHLADQPILAMDLVHALLVPCGDGGMDLWPGLWGVYFEEIVSGGAALHSYQVLPVWLFHVRCRTESLYLILSRLFS